MRALSSLAGGVMGRGVAAALEPDERRICTTLAASLPRDRLPQSLLERLDEARVYETAGEEGGGLDAAGGGDALGGGDVFDLPQGAGWLAEQQGGEGWGGAGADGVGGAYDFQRAERTAALGDADSGGLGFSAGAPLFAAAGHERGASAALDGKGGGTAGGDAAAGLLRLDEDLELVLEDEEEDMGSQRQDGGAGAPASEGHALDAAAPRPPRGGTQRAQRLPFGGRVSVTGQVRPQGGKKGGQLPPSSKPLKDVGKANMQVG
jgi:hypothetical protein